MTYFYPRSPRGERLADATRKEIVKDFYPRSPRGERQAASAAASAHKVFLSTLPARGATYFKPCKEDEKHEFLSTLPARGATLSFTVAF